MATLPFNVLIFGGTGVIGKYITDAILSAGASPGHTISLFTSDATAADAAKASLLASWTSRGLRVVTGDIANAQDVSRAYEGVDVVVSCVGRNVLAQQIELLRLAEESASVKWFFPSEYGTDVEYDASSKDEKTHQIKLKVRGFIRDNLKRVQATSLVTGPYIDMYLPFIPGAEAVGGYDVQAKRAVVVGSGNDPVGFTSMPDVGKLLVAALRHPAEAKDGVFKALKVQSFVTTPLEILQEYEKQTGEKWTAEHTSNQALRDLETRLWDEKNPLATLATLGRIWAEGGTLYEKTDNEKLGVSPQDLESLGDVVARDISGVGY
ncbi:hypothetical protein F4859DRAFT_456161 [Xylaria cf. heliscus]|nr:hypothetical protein F4859DRAFT_456161 [Xylaria cf. heliscus]